MRLNIECNSHGWPVVAVGDLKCEHIEHESDRMANGSSLKYCGEEETTLNVSTYRLGKVELPMN